MQIYTVKNICTLMRFQQPNKKYNKFHYFGNSLKSVRWFLYIHFWNKKKAKPFWRQNDALVIQERPSYWYCEDVWWFWARETHRHVCQLGMSSELDHFKCRGSTHINIVSMIFQSRKIGDAFFQIQQIHIKVFRFLSSPTKISRHSMWTNSELRWSWAMYWWSSRVQNHHT